MSTWTGQRRRGAFTLTGFCAEDFWQCALFDPGTLTFACVRIELVHCTARFGAIIALACTGVIVEYLTSRAFCVGLALALAGTRVERLPLAAFGGTTAFTSAGVVVENLVLIARRVGWALAATALRVKHLVLGALLVAKRTSTRAETFVEPLITGAGCGCGPRTSAATSVVVKDLWEVGTRLACVGTLALTGVSVLAFWSGARGRRAATCTCGGIHHLVRPDASTLAPALTGNRIKHLRRVALVLSRTFAPARVWVKVLCSRAVYNCRTATLAVFVVVCLLGSAGLSPRTLAATGGSVVDMWQFTPVWSRPTGALTSAGVVIELLVFRAGEGGWAEALTAVVVKYLPWRTPFPSRRALTLTRIRIEFLRSTTLWCWLGTFTLAGFVVDSFIRGAVGGFGTAALAGVLVKHQWREAGTWRAGRAAARTEKGVKVLSSCAVGEIRAPAGARSLVESLFSWARGVSWAPTLAASLVKYLVLLAPLSGLGRTLALAGHTVEDLRTSTLSVV